MSENSPFSPVYANVGRKRYIHGSQFLALTPTRSVMLDISSNCPDLGSMSLDENTMSLVPHQRNGTRGLSDNLRKLWNFEDPTRLFVPPLLNETSEGYATRLKLYRSEVHYREKLVILDEMYIERLRRKAVLSRRDYDILFIHFDQLFHLNAAVINGLGKGETLEEIFKNNSNFTEVFESYISDYRSSVWCLAKAFSDHNFKTIIDEVVNEEETCGFALLDLLTCPLLRIAEINRILSDFNLPPIDGAEKDVIRELKNTLDRLDGFTEQSHEEYNIYKALTSIEASLGLSYEISTTRRTVIMSGFLYQISRKVSSPQKLKLWLFEDVLLVGKLATISNSSYTPLVLLPLQKLECTYNVDAGCINFSCGSYQLSVTGSTYSLMKPWLEAIYKQINRTKENPDHHHYRKKVIFGERNSRKTFFSTVTSSFVRNRISHNSNVHGEQPKNASTLDCVLETGITSTPRRPRSVVANSREQRGLGAFNRNDWRKSVYRPEISSDFDLVAHSSIECRRAGAQLYLKEFLEVKSEETTSDKCVLM